MFTPCTDTQKAQSTQLTGQVERSGTWPRAGSKCGRQRGSSAEIAMPRLVGAERPKCQGEKQKYNERCTETFEAKEFCGKRGNSEKIQQASEKVLCMDE